MKTTKTQKISITKATILDWSRERNTVYGNPVYSFTITDEGGKVYRGKTRPNAGFVYCLSNGTSSLTNVVIATTPSGRVYMDNAEDSK
jgi:hypothetical protein